MGVLLKNKHVLSHSGSSKLEEACDMLVRAANMYKMAKNWCGKMIVAFQHNKCIECLFLFFFSDFKMQQFIFLIAAGNAFSQAAHLHLQMQSKHDAATNFIDAGNAFKKADPQGKRYITLGYII